MGKDYLVKFSLIMPGLLLSYVFCCPMDRPTEGCGVGYCQNNRCVCPKGFWGSRCEKGRERLGGTSLSGHIIDGSGNYLQDSKYQFLIDSGRKNASIRIKFGQFETECNWDHLYVYDGWSIYDPLVAVWSGRVHGKESQNETKKMLTTKSGAAYLYFYSDKHQAALGFNISYRISNCSTTCSNHGFCNSSGVCECDDFWTGHGCSIRKCCPSGAYNLLNKEYTCLNQEYGASCPSIVSARASHATVLQGNYMYVYGGYSFVSEDANNLLRYDFKSKQWMTVDASPPLMVRYGHSMTIYSNNLYIYGGTLSNAKISNELRKFSILTKTWKRIDPLGSIPVPVTGHTAVVVGNKMFVMMGYSPTMSFSPDVQEFNLDTLEWKILQTSGAIMQGIFGHTATYDVVTDLIYVYGGYASKPVNEISDKLWVFSPGTKSWSILANSGFPRKLHSAAIVGRQIVIFGGNTHYFATTTDNSLKTKCHSNEVIVYNIDCKRWITLSLDKLLDGKDRYGHTAVTINRTMYVFGGFSGVLKNDILPVTIGDCSKFLTKSACVAKLSVANCIWNKGSGKCIGAEEASVLPSSQLDRPFCNASSIICNGLKSCDLCLSSSPDCVWCANGNKCKDKCTSPKSIEIVTAIKCPAKKRIEAECGRYSSCYSCELQSNCTWSKPNCKYDDGVKTSHNASFVCNRGSPSKAVCANITLCSECVSSALGCMWCESQKKCVETASYVMNYPYGQCLEWAVQGMCSALRCSQRKTCKECFDLPGCGWCNDPNDTGLGKCMEGSDFGPRNITQSQCPASRWFFTECPACQCNGHSQCINGSCIKCKGNITGVNCESCAPWFFGDSRNNGTCQACSCNKHGLSCNPTTGICQCDTKGITGDHCERCDIGNRYVGNASDGGFCLYPLRVGFQYTFNITDKSKINFLGRPEKDDKDIEFEIKIYAGGTGRMDFSLTRGGVERFIKKAYPIGHYKKRFSAEDEKFSASRGEPIFKVYLYGWTKGAAFHCLRERIWILCGLLLFWYKKFLKSQRMELISFASQPSPFDWLHFLIVFLICFCSLLIILIVMWRLKQHYENFRFNRRRRIQLDEMASRPCATSNLLLSRHTEGPSKIEPSIVGLEPFIQGHSAVASILIELPRTEKGAAPLGQSGLCLGSTLVTYRNPKVTSSTTQQLCVFRERRKRQRRTPVNV